MKILFITSTRIGDAVLTTGVLSYLLDKYPDARVTIACGPAAAPLFEAVPRCDRVISMIKGKRGRHWINLWKECYGTHWDIIVDLRRSVIGFLLRASTRYYLKQNRERIHRVRQIADVFDLPEPPLPVIWTADQHEARADSLIPPGNTVIGIGPTANWEAKTWRDDNFVALFDRLTGAGGLFPNARIAIFGAPNERDRAQKVIDAIPADRRIDLVGTVDLLTAYACLKRCAMYIGNDSALMHLAAASGIPTLGLFGPSNEANYAPWGWQATHIRTPEAFEDIFPEDFDHTTARTMMDSLTVDMVEKKAVELWHSTRDTAA